MTTAVFKTDGDRICSFTVSGHSGYDAEGSDIVCAAVTSAVRFAECAMNTVLGLGIPFKVDEETATVTCRLPQGFTDEQDEVYCQNLLVALMVYLAELKEEYPNNIDVIEQ